MQHRESLRLAPGRVGCEGQGPSGGVTGMWAAGLEVEVAYQIHGMGVPQPISESGLGLALFSSAPSRSAGTPSPGGLSPHRRAS